MCSQSTSRAAALLVGTLPLLLSCNLWAADSAADAIQAKWQPQEIRYSYVGFTTAYNCDAFETKLKNILKTLGAHPQTQVRAAGCDFNRPSRNFFVTVTTASPVPAAEAGKNAEPGAKSREELLKRLGVKSTFDTDEFPAQWQTVDLSRDRRLDLQPGDCELMEGLTDHVLPKLSVKVISDKVQCTPKQLSIQTPELKVSALLAVPKPDAKPEG